MTAHNISEKTALLSEPWQTKSYFCLWTTSHCQAWGCRVLYIFL